VSDEQPGDGLSAAAPQEYEPPKLAIYESDAPVEWAALRSGESAPDDLLGSSASATPSSDASPKVLHWSAPEPEYQYPEPGVFVAPEDPSKKVSGPKKVPKKTDKPGKVTRAHTTKTRLTGKDAFGGTICTCNLVCSCNQVCTCEAVAACSCVSDSGGGGGGGGTCSCNAQCTCQSVSSCSCQSDSCSCQAQPY
jgi:hypothetical protein